MKKTLIVVMMLLGCLVAVNLNAAPRDAGKQDNGAVQKLQVMVKSVTSERDAAKAESAKLTAELEQLKKESSKNLAAATAAKDQLDSELAAQKSSNTDIKDRLDKTSSRLQEVIDKYKELQKLKNETANQLAILQSKQAATEQQLQTCAEQNIKLFKSSKELLENYETKGTVSSLLQDEPLLQFNSVEMENLIQEYEDKLHGGKYYGAPATMPVPAAPSAPAAAPPAEE